MPFRDASSSSFSSSSSPKRRNNRADGTHIVSDDMYPAVSFPGYHEKPLSQQLEPTAVVGVGCRLPGDVSSPSGSWDLMIEKRSGQTPKVPSKKIDWKGWKVAVVKEPPHRERQIIGPRLQAWTKSGQVRPSPAELASRSNVT